MVDRHAVPDVQSFSGEHLPQAWVMLDECAEALLAHASAGPERLATVKRILADVAGDEPLSTFVLGVVLQIQTARA